jgi:4-hydroxybutyrate dehydrogenase
MQFLVKPRIHKFDNCKEFIEYFSIGAGDLIITNEFIYKPFFTDRKLGAAVIYQEKYGAGEPSDEMIDNILRDISGARYDRVIAVGGGTVIDIAKLLALKDVKSTLELFEKRIPIIKEKDLILVPTTCGTGSEVTNISIVEIKSKHTKMGLAVDELYADNAVLIPELVTGLPYKYFITSSIDALIHAIESFVSPKSNSYTRLFSVKAIELIIKGYQKIIEHGEDYRSRILEDFLTASNYAGISFANTGVGAVHAMSYPLGGTYHVPHGEANYQFFIEVFKTYNRIKPDGRINDINLLLASILDTGTENIYDHLSELLEPLLSRKPLREYGMLEEDIQGFTDSVLATQQRLLANNYVPLSREELLGIYKRLC